MVSESKPDNHIHERDAQIVSNQMIEYWHRTELRLYAREAEIKKMREALERIATGDGMFVHASGETLRRIAKEALGA